MIFLTGGTGLLGSHILQQLRRQDYPVAALVRSDQGAEMVMSQGAVAVRGSVEDPHTWAHLSRCSAIIHSAALIAGREPWESYQRVNVEATRLAAERARQLSVTMIHISSVAVYGGGIPGERIGESHGWAPIAPQEYYARSKRLAEAAVWKEEKAGLSATVIRPCVVYGEGDRLFFPRIVRAFHHGIVPILGSGRRALALVYAGNVAQAVLLALASPIARGQAYNVTNDGVITARGFVEAVGRGLERKIRTVYLPVAPALGIARVADRMRSLTGPARYPGSLSAAVRFWRGGNPYSSEKAIRELGWHPESRHDEAIERSVRALSPA